MKYLKAIILASAAYSSSALAQTGEASGSGLEEIIVTAQKRSESLQDTPISIAAFDSKALEAKGISTLADIASGVPNLQISPHPNSANSVRAIIRGIGELANVVTRDAPVAIYQDGVYMGRTQGLGSELAELERIEVLRGPQGTLYGRNATAGAINFISRAPELGNFGGNIKLTIGNFQERRLRGSVNIPLGDTLAVELSYLKVKKDGFINNRGTGHSRFGSLNRDAIRIAALWQPTDDVEARYTYDSAWIKDASPFLANVPLYPAEALRPRASSPSVRDFRPNDTRTQGHNLTLSYDLNDNLTIKSITAHRKLNSFEYQDYHSGILSQSPIFTIADSVRQKQFSQELQLIGEGLDGQIKYISGLYYFKESGDGVQVQTLTGSVSPRAVNFKNIAYSAFAQATYTPSLFGERLHITVGGRLSKDKRSASVLTTRTLTGGDAVSTLRGSGDRSFSDFSPTATIQFDITKNVNIYAKVTKGYKTGGFTPTASSSEAFARGFAPETLVSYETGLKSELFDRRIRFNAALFYNDYKDIQLSVLDPVDPRITDVINAGKAVTKGFEAELTGLIFEGFSISGSYGYVNAKYKEVRDLSGNDITAGFRFTNAPRHSFTLSADYRSPETSLGIVEANVSYAWQDKYQALANDPRYVVHSNGLLNGRLGIADAFGQKGLGLAVWARNLTNENYYLSHFPGGVPSAIFGEPRSYGVDLKFDF